MPPAVADALRKRAPLAKFVPLDRNPRRGNVEALKASLVAHGQYKPIVVRKATMEIIVGNHTWLAAGELEMPKLAYIELDCDAEQARKIALVDNRTSELGSFDHDLLVAELQALGDAPDALEGTGYSRVDLDSIIKRHKGDGPAPPPAFAPVDPDDMETEYRCPGCGYEWSGNPK